MVAHISLWRRDYLITVEKILNYTPSLEKIHLTEHATKRMQQRQISQDMVNMVSIYGRTIYSRGATFKVIGRKEVEAWAHRGIDLRAAEGLHVLLSGDGAVMTTYRNHNLRKIRPSKRRHSFYH